MIKEKIKQNSGFVILFAVTLSGILLAIALGVANISTEEIKFGTSAKKTNEAFFAADSGIEYVLFNDKSDSSIYVPTPGTEQSWIEIIPGLGSSGTSCAKVYIYKNNLNTSIPVITNIVSKGYDVGDKSCESTNPDRVEREIEVNY
jgi:hypothetical protein